MICRLASLIVLAALLSIAIPVDATSEEVLWGLYSYRGKKLTVGFRWDKNGITQMRINGKEYESSRITSQSFSTYEAWVIRVKESERRQKILQLAFLVRNYKVEFVSGYFADIEDTEGNLLDFDIKAVQSIEMKYAPIPKG